MQYAFKDEEHPIDLQPHGNCKRSSRGFVRTLESTKKDLVEESRTCKPKATFHKVLSSLGGNNNLAEIRSVGAIPKSRAQGSKLSITHKQNDLKSACKNISNALNTPLSGLSSKDPWYNLLLECKMRGNNVAFIRNVKLAPEPSCVLASNRQLHDLARFCCNPYLYQPLTVDPTFNLGEFNVTIVTYKHLILKSRRGGGTPCLVGPVMIHNRKTRESYSQLCSTMRTLEPTLKNLLAFGTDEEKALIDAFESNFDSAVHVLCTRHLRSTCKSHFKSLGVPEGLNEEMLNDIFGSTWDGMEHKGVIDAKSETEFRDMCAAMGEEWVTKHPAGVEAFGWFMKNKAKVLIEKAIVPVRVQAGLGDPPLKFYTNQSESNNNLVQRFVEEETGSKKVDEYVFYKSLEKLVSRQTTDIELAVSNRGPYEICEDFSDLLISENKWVKMSPKQRSNAIGKVHSLSVSESNTKVSLTTTVQRHQQSPIESKLHQEGIDWVPSDVLEAMVNKAEGILQNKQNLVLAPGSQTTLVVPSQSNPESPRLVQKQPSGRLICSCAQYISMSICSHSLVYAQHLEAFPSYLKWLKCQRRRKGGDAINISSLACHGMPAGRGRKGGRVPRKKGQYTPLNRSLLNVNDGAEVINVEQSGESTSNKVSYKCVQQSSRVVADPATPLTLGPPSSGHIGASHTPPSLHPPFSGHRENAATPLTLGPSSSGHSGASVTPRSLQPPSLGYSNNASTPLCLGPSSLGHSSSSLVSLGTPSTSHSDNAAVPQSLCQTFSSTSGNTVSVDSSKNHWYARMVDGPRFLLQPGNNNFTILQSSPSVTHPIFSQNPLPGIGNITAMQWHSGMSPYHYEVALLPKNVQKCYGCGRQFVEKYRTAPHNVIIKHIDRRVRGKDTVGNLVLCHDFSATYYHPDSKHVVRKNPFFNNAVYISNSLFLQLSTEQLDLIHQGNLTIQFL